MLISKSRSLVFSSVAALFLGTMSDAVCQINKAAVRNLPVRPLDITGEGLPPAFTGNSIVAIFQAVAHRPDLQKSEFETADQYQNRIATLAQSKLLDNLPLNGTVSFVLTCDSNYDAETQTLRVLFALVAQCGLFV
jgi:hypothetical protein